MARPGIGKNIKFKRLVHTLGIPRPYVLGLLETLWEVAYEAARAVIGTEHDIEIAAEWPGDPGVLFEALKEGGWIEEIEGQWQIHDLLENAPEYVKKRAKRNSEREKVADNVGQRLTTGAFPSPPGPAPPGPTHPKNKEEPPQPPRGSGSNDHIRKKSARKPKRPAYTEPFEAFWATYPLRNGVRVGKAKAFAQFEKIDPGRLQSLSQAVENLSNAVAAGQLPKDAERFLKIDPETGSAPWEEWVDQTDAGTVVVVQEADPMVEFRRRHGLPETKGD